MTEGVDVKRTEKISTAAWPNRFSTANKPFFSFRCAEFNLHVIDFTATERISAPFEVMLTLAAEDEISFDDIVGQPATLTIDYFWMDRYFHGIVDAFTQTGISGRFFTYRARMVPLFCTLSLMRDCRIFQKKSIPEVVKQVLKKGGIIGDVFEFRLQGRFEPREYCVQYRESDFDFICRLLEEEGIFYFFEHEKDKHKLVFGNSPITYQPISRDPEVVFNPVKTMASDKQSISRFQLSRTLCTDKYTLRDFNYAKPRLRLTFNKDVVQGNQREQYDYPGYFQTESQGKRLARIRFEEMMMFRDKAEGESICHSFLPGYTFDLAGHVISDFNQSYVLWEVKHAGSQPQVMQEHTAANTGGSYGNLFYALPSNTTIRPLRSTPRPEIKGVQTAVVTGPEGEEIYTDKHGRVKVQFHWDRLGKCNERSSCWIRVSQTSAGAGWGAMNIPRIGQEVIVVFLEGDPDRPIIIGRVYNGENRPPFDLPAQRTVHGLKSNTTPGGGGYNQISMDDAKDKQAITIHAQKNMNTTVENDNAVTIGHDQSLSVKNNLSLIVDNDQETTIEKNRTTLLTQGSDKLTIKSGSRTVSITDGNQATTVDGGYILSTASKGVAISGNSEGVSISGNGKGVVINGTKGDGVTVTGEPTIRAVGKSSVTVSSPNVHIGDDSINIQGSNIILSTRGGSITLDATGVTIKGLFVNAAGVQKVAMGVGSNAAEYSPHGITTSGVQITTTAMGQHQISGALIKIN